MKNKPQHQVERLGLDFGKVIMGAIIDGKQDTSFLGTTYDQAMDSPATEGAIEAVRHLVEAFGDEVWIVSKCGPSVEKKTRGWLMHNDFYAQTGLLKSNLVFCRKRPEKAPICQRLGINSFVDDRLDVLEPMKGIVPNLYLFGEQRRDLNVPNWVHHVPDWDSVLEQLVGAPATIN